MSFFRKHIILPAAAVTALMAGLLFTTTGVALAHGKTTVGDYDLVIGFHNEPPVVGEVNSLDLFVTNSKTGEKIDGLDQTLQAEIIFGASKKTIELYAQDEGDGAYGADVIPTRAGDYTWHIWGKIKDTPVDVKMTSSPTTFETVAAKSDLSFPDALPGEAEVQAQASAAQGSAQTALIVGIVAALLGLVAIVLSIVRTRPAQGPNKS